MVDTTKRLLESERPGLELNFAFGLARSKWSVQFLEACTRNFPSSVS